jgi:hypothetical protein
MLREHHDFRRGFEQRRQQSSGRALDLYECVRLCCQEVGWPFQERQGRQAYAPMTASQVFGVGVLVVALPGLAGPAAAAAVMGDGAVAVPLSDTSSRRSSRRAPERRDNVIHASWWNLMAWELAPQYWQLPGESDLRQPQDGPNPVATAPGP